MASVGELGSAVKVANHGDMASSVPKTPRDYQAEIRALYRKEMSCDSVGTSIFPNTPQTIWLHKTPDAQMPKENLQNVINFARTNQPHQKVFLLTDNPRKIQDRLTELFPKNCPENLHIENIDAATDFKDFPRTKEFAKALIPVYPAGAKDLYSYDLLTKPNIVFDSDIHFPEPLPVPFRMCENFAAPGEENYFMAYAGGESNPMRDLLKHIEEQIPDMFEIQRKCGVTTFSLNHSLRAVNKSVIGGKVLINDMLQYSKYKQVIRTNKAGDLNNYLQFKADHPTYGFGEQFPESFSLSEKPEELNSIA